MGLVIPVAGLRRLRNAGIYCVPGVTMEYQQSKKRAVLRGLESGGASPEIGRYVTFCDDDGSPVRWLHPVQGIVGNGVHAVEDTFHEYGKTPPEQQPGDQTDA